MALTPTVASACTRAEYSVAPPLCRAGQAEGTQVEVFPYREYRGSNYAAPEDLDAFLQVPRGGLYAVYRIPEGSFAEAWWPVGEYSVVFVSAEGDLGVEVVIEGDDVVRIEFWPLTPGEALDGAEVEYL